MGFFKNTIESIAIHQNEILFGTASVLTGMWAQYKERNNCDQRNLIKAYNENAPFTFGSLGKGIPRHSHYNQHARLSEIMTVALKVLPTLVYALRTTSIVQTLGETQIKVLCLTPVVSRMTLYLASKVSNNTVIFIYDGLDGMIRIAFEYVQVALFVMGAMVDPMSLGSLGKALLPYIQVYTVKKVAWFVIHRMPFSYEAPYAAISTTWFARYNFTLSLSSKVYSVASNVIYALITLALCTPKYIHNQRINLMELRIKKLEKLMCADANKENIEVRINANQWLKKVIEERQEQFGGSLRPINDYSWVFKQLVLLDQIIENRKRQEMIHDIVTQYPEKMRYDKEELYLNYFESLLVDIQNSGQDLVII